MGVQTIVLYNTNGSYRYPTTAGTVLRAAKLREGTFPCLFLACSVLCISYTARDRTKCRHLHKYNSNSGGLPAPFAPAILMWSMHRKIIISGSGILQRCWLARTRLLIHCVACLSPRCWYRGYTLCSGVIFWGGVTTKPGSLTGGLQHISRDATCGQSVTSINAGYDVLRVLHSIPKMGP